ncbi:hypothetical protein WJX72_010614 [[Myrmecia] bisecta]|uniref:Uncharacterized protein n=1 Tax=[Myrmecia] bisecta TaxID=41462 RepID=A0AAW1Q4Q4_9CHLO
MEEVDKASRLGGAESDILSKTAWIPHFALLPFVIGITIAADLFQFFTYIARGQRRKVQLDISNVEDRANWSRQKAAAKYSN